MEKCSNNIKFDLFSPFILPKSVRCYLCIKIFVLVAENASQNFFMIYYPSIAQNVYVKRPIALHFIFIFKTALALYFLQTNKNLKVTSIHKKGELSFG